MPQFIANHMEAWFHWLTALAIILPLIGGFAGWGAWIIGDKLDEISTKAAQDELADTRSKLASAEEAARAANVIATATQAQLAPRHLTAEDKTKFVDAVMTQPKGRVIVEYISDINDKTFAIELQSLLKETGYEVDPWLTPTMRIGDRIVGIKLHVLSRANEPAHVAGIATALMSIGLTVKGEDGDTTGWGGQGKLDSNTVALIVGYKK